jgi:microcystin degradation protein MlrC
MKRILIGAILHETNTVNPVPTTLDDCRVNGLYFGDEVIERRRDTRTELGGFLDILAPLPNIDVLPAVNACPMPGGKVTGETISTLLDALLDPLTRATPDAVLLALHGAMVIEDYDDGDGYILRRVRETVGEDVPIIITLDLHATLTRDIARYADGVTVYRTYPHMDMFERGREAAEMVLASVAGDIRPVAAVSKCPLLIGPPHNVLPQDSPMSHVFKRAREMEEEIPGVLACCPAHGFMQQDVPEAGAGAIVTTDGDPDLAHRCAEELTDILYSNRHHYFVSLPTPAEAVWQALHSETIPVAVADAGDNIGGGTPGDGTALLHEILRQGVESAFVQLCDPVAARTAADAGVGETLSLTVGGRSDPVYGPPVELTGTVRMISDGRFVNRAEHGYCAGVEQDMGLSARIDVGGITVVLTSNRISPNNAMHAYAMGVYPEDYRMTVCKGGLAFREAYKPPLANRYIQCNSPGWSSPDIETFGFTRIPRPIFPLDDI